MSLQIFIEYKVKEARVEKYEEVMKEVLQKLPEYSAEKIEWFVATDQPFLYVEMFRVPNIAHYQALKKMRQSKDHPVFSKLDEFIEGGLEKLNCWAFQTQPFQND
ncbi:hypothetical protein BKP35_07320 [Anaerobacillus arseniciselenatis]|uniref:ABM domain-containing protein n=1 Tax=Anaerobacillus arseniciselenatis TaxID=85682 RepID=A0A1S2LN94_9BACI|nr:hypothetical protein [Anaerobacillus arseniciselenatis]OIJ14009.1 hypothetical protein BKP35_07320 [Anaerobacillus arseniciselenatis]